MNSKTSSSNFKFIPDPKDTNHSLNRANNIIDYKERSIAKLKTLTPDSKNYHGVGVGQKRNAEDNAYRLEEKTRNRYVKRIKTITPLKSEYAIENEIKDNFSEKFKLVINNVVISADKLKFTPGTSKDYKQKPVFARLKSYIFDNSICNIFKRNMFKIKVTFQGLAFGVLSPFIANLAFPEFVTALFGGTQQVMDELIKQKKLIKTTLLNENGIQNYIDNMSGKEKSIFNNACQFYNMQIMMKTASAGVEFAYDNIAILGFIAVVLYGAGKFRSAGNDQENKYNGDIIMMEQIAKDLDDVIMEDINYNEKKNEVVFQLTQKDQYDNLKQSTLKGKEKKQKLEHQELQQQIMFLNSLKQHMSLVQIYYYAVKKYGSNELLSTTNTNDLFTVVFGTSLEHLKNLHAMHPETTPDELKLQNINTNIQSYTTKMKYYKLMLTSPFKAYAEFMTLENYNLDILKYVFGEGNLQALERLYTTNTAKFKNFTLDEIDVKNDMGLEPNKYNSVAVGLFIEFMVQSFEDQVETDEKKNIINNKLQEISQYIFPDSKDQQQHLEMWLNCDKEKIKCKKLIMFLVIMKQKYNVSIRNTNDKNKDGFNIIFVNPRKVEYSKGGSTLESIDVDMFVETFDLENGRNFITQFLEKITKGLFV